MNILSLLCGIVVAIITFWLLGYALPLWAAALLALIAFFVIAFYVRIDDRSLRRR